MKRQRAGAVFVVSGVVFGESRTLLAALAAKVRMPTVMYERTRRGFDAMNRPLEKRAEKRYA